MKSERVYTFRTVLQALADECDIRTSALAPIINLPTENLNRQMDEETYSDILSRFKKALENTSSVYPFIKAIANLAKTRLSDEKANQHLLRKNNLTALPKP